MRQRRGSSWAWCWARPRPPARNCAAACVADSLTSAQLSASPAARWPLISPPSSAPAPPAPSPAAASSTVHTL